MLKDTYHKVADMGLEIRPPYFQPATLPISLNETGGFSYFIHSLLETELVLQEKEMPGGKTDKSGITQALNFYFVIFTI